MGRRKKPFLENIQIEDIGAEGKSIAKVEGKIVFVPYGIPGDIVDVQVTTSRKKFYEGYITNFHKKSDIRTNPFCEHFGICGGCKWQNLPYKEQLKYKQKQVTDHFERIGKITGYKINPIKPSEDTRYYRNKLEFTFSDSRWLTEKELRSDITFDDRTALGFHVPKKFDKIIDIENCYLQRNPSNDIRLAIREFARQHQFSFFNILKQEGFLRNLIIRTTETDEIMVIISFFYDDPPKREQLLNHVAERFPFITSLMYVINEKQNETLYDQDIILFKGSDHIIEVLDNLSFKIGPKSFYQTNSKQTAVLYNIVEKMADLTCEDVVYDLYTGTGTIANYLARKCKKVIGIEIVPEAIEDAKINARQNNLKNVSFYTSDVKDIIHEDFIKQNGRPDVIILDPPRAGIHNKVTESLLELKAGKIVYVSCNPATQARDLNILKEKYSVDEIQPVDMFPHTHHVENVTKLTLKNAD